MINFDIDRGINVSTEAGMYPFTHHYNIVIVYIYTMHYIIVFHCVTFIVFNRIDLDLKIKTGLDGSALYIIKFSNCLFFSSFCLFVLSLFPSFFFLFLVQPFDMIFNHKQIHTQRIIN